MLRAVLLAVAMGTSALDVSAPLIQIQAIQVGDSVEWVGSGAFDLTGFGTPRSVWIGFFAEQAEP